MKRIVSLICVFGLLIAVHAQPVCLALATNKTTSLVFPFAVTHVDQGNPAVLVQPVKSASNILLVKANVADFAETNLSVITSDGSLYQFEVVYNEVYPSLSVYLPALRSSSIAGTAEAIRDNPPMLKSVRHRKWDMTMEVTGIYVKKNILYFQLTLRNDSPIDYDTDLLQLFIRDRKKAKRTALQEIALLPLHVAGDAKFVKAYSKNVIVVALDKFTIPDAKLFVLQLLERNGGRHLQLRLQNNHLLKAILLPDMH